MADLIKKIKIKKQDGTFTDYIPIGAEAQNISTSDGDSVQLKLNKKPYYYNSVADIKGDMKLKAGDKAATLGYYEVNDGGGATYKITNVESETEYQEELENGLYASLIVDENTNVKHFGAKGNDSYNDTNSFIKYINYCNKNNKNIKIPIGKYRIYEDLPSLKRTVCINGEVGNNAVQRDSYNKSLILDYRNSENYLKIKMY